MRVATCILGIIKLMMTKIVIYEYNINCLKV